MYKAIFTDLDGTLLPSDKQMSSYTKEVIAKVRELGIKVILASGRSVKAMRAFHQELKLNEPLIGYNGAQIEVDGEEFYYNPLPKELAQALLEFSLAQEIYFQYYDKETLTTLTKYSQQDNFIQYSQHNGLNTYHTTADKLNLSSVTKWMFVDHDRTTLEKIAKLVKQNFGEQAGMSYTSDIFFEVYHHEVNKGNAARQVMQLYGWDSSEILSFGDNYNDIELIQSAQMSFAMCNAPKEVQQMARMISDHTSDEDGVARILSAIFLKN